MPTQRLATVLLPLAAAAAIAGCGSSSSSNSPASTGASSGAASGSGGAAPSSGSGPAVTMQNIAYSPQTLTAKVGQTVTFTNQDSVAHNVMHVSGPSFAPSPTMSPGQTFTLKLTKAGTISYFCSIHPFMKGTITVTG